MRNYLRRLFFSLSDKFFRMAIKIEGERGEEDLLRYPECMFTSSKAQTLKNLNDRLEDYIESRKLYLDPYLSLSRIASQVGSNRTYISNLLSTKKGFRTYLNELRFKSIFQQIASLPSNTRGILSEDEERVDAAEYAFIILRSGFADLRTFRRQLSVINGEWASRLRSILY
jgi:AraC-like DNA-binding protein